MNLFRLGLFACLGGLLSIASPTFAQPHTLTSDHLKIRVQEEPYSFEVVERSSGEVLLSHANTEFQSGLLSKRVEAAVEVRTTNQSIQSTLNLAASSQTATLHLDLATPRRVTIRLRHPNPNATTTVAFEDEGQHYYGLWEHTHGRDLDNRGAQHALVGRDYEHEKVYAASARAPFYMMSNGLGVYAETEASGQYSVARSDTTRFTFQTGTLTYHLLYGPSYKRILQEYNRLAGPADMPPTWAMSSIWWRDDHHNIPDQVQGISSAQDLLLRDVEMLQEHRFPAATMWIDRPFTTGDWGWGGTEFAESFPPSDDSESVPSFSNPGRMAQTVRENGMRLLYWITFRAAHTLKDGLAAKNLLFDGYTDHPAADLRQSKTYLHYKDFLDSLATAVTMPGHPDTPGVYGYKIDRGGESEMPDSLINKQVTLFNRAAHEQIAAHHGDDVFLFARSLHDKSRRWVAHWNGDPQDTFQALRTSMKNGLRAGLMNFPMWGSDIGGYWPKEPSKELMIRWIGFGTYSTMMEFMLEGRNRWYYGDDEDVISVTRQATQTHHDLIPYTRSVLYHAHQTGVPVMRAMLLEYPEAPTVSDMWDQFFYGPNLLVAPVSRKGVREREVYLPEGRWLNYNDRSTVEQGGRSVTEAAPLGTVPRFVREGAIIPRGDILKANQQWKTDWSPALRIEVFPARTDTTTFDYYTGEDIRTITSAVSDEALEISFEALDHDGQLEIYADDVTEVVRDGETLPDDAYEYDPDRNVLTVPFSGATTVRLPGASSIF